MTTAPTDKREASKPFIFCIHTCGSEQISVKLLKATYNIAMANYGNPPTVRIDYGYEGYTYGQFLGARKYFKVERIEISTNVELDITNPLSWKTIDDVGHMTGGGVFLRKSMPGKYIAEPLAPFNVTPDTEISYIIPGGAQVVMSIFPMQGALGKKGYAYWSAVVMSEFSTQGASGPAVSFEEQTKKLKTMDRVLKWIWSRF